MIGSRKERGNWPLGEKVQHTPCNRMHAVREFENYIILCNMYECASSETFGVLQPHIISGKYVYG